jgi:hypothetical protein
MRLSLSRIVDPFRRVLRSDSGHDMGRLNEGGKERRYGLQNEVFDRWKRSYAKNEDRISKAIFKNCMS